MSSPIEIHSAFQYGLNHWVYEAGMSDNWRLLCDGSPWRSNGGGYEVGGKNCEECTDIYAHDIAFGPHRLQYVESFDETEASDGH